MLSATVVSMSCHLLPNLIIRDIFQEKHCVVLLGCTFVDVWQADGILEIISRKGRSKRCYGVHANSVEEG